MKLSEEPQSAASRAIYPVAILLITALVIALGFQNCSSSKAVQFQVGNSQIASAPNSAVTSLAPATSTISAGSTQQLSSLNAPTSSQYVLISGGGSVDATSGLYTAPNSETIAVIGLSVNGAVIDGVQSTITVTAAVASLTVGSANLNVMAGLTLALTVAGGTPPYVFSVLPGGSGAGTVDASSGVLTGLAIGTVLVQVADSAGLLGSTTVTVISDLSLPSNVSLAVGKSTTLTATGGQPPITYSVAPVNEGNGSIDAATGVFSALAAGDVSVIATDSVGHSTIVSVTVTEIQFCALVNEGEAANVQCPGTSKIKSLDFASFGTPTGGAVGDCTGLPFVVGTCDAANSVSIVESTCPNGTASCVVEASDTTFINDPCVNTPKQLAIQVTCY